MIVNLRGEAIVSEEWKMEEETWGNGLDVYEGQAAALFTRHLEGSTVGNRRYASVHFMADVICGAGCQLSQV